VNILVDMNLSQEWVPLLARPDWTIRRWSEVGKPNAEDQEIAKWAAENNFAVLTQDLDFSDILFMTQAAAPTVILLRAQNENSPQFRAHVQRCLIEVEKQLHTPSLVVIDAHHARWRPLPIGGTDDD
jgi:predicted nuclease of predicted toxin-antitoxin system